MEKDTASLMIIMILNKSDRDNLLNNEMLNKSDMNRRINKWQNRI